jgi:hypothetical protein
VNRHPRDTAPAADPPFSGALPGTALGPVEYGVPATANDRYWRAAGIEHAARDAGVLYPPMAANLTIMAFQTIAPAALLHTAQRIECHAAATAPNTLTVTGSVTGRFERRGRDYIEVTTIITDAADTHLWTSVATFIEAGA